MMNIGKSAKLASVKQCKFKERDMKLMRIALTGSLLLVLAACGNDSPITDPQKPPTNPDTPGLPGLPGGLPITPGTPAGSGISGTVTAPGGASASGTIVIACAESDTECSSALTTTADTAGAYSFTDLQTTPYALVAFQDVDGSQNLTNGDYLGGYSTDNMNLTPVTPPADGINITMQVYDDGSGTPTTPTDPGAGGSISGTISPPGAVSGDSAVVALYLTDDQNDPFDYDLSGVADIPAGSSFSYSVDSLTAGQYLIVGLSDVDGNGSFDDATDYVGIYPSFDTAEPVSPPAVSIDFPMITNSELDTLSIQSTAKAAKVSGAARASLNNHLLEGQLEQALKALH